MAQVVMRLAYEQKQQAQSRTPQKVKPDRFPDRALGSDETFRSLLIAATALTPDNHNRD